MAHDDDDQQREGNKRLRNERYEADNHGAARPLWPPRQADNRLPLGIGKRDDLVVSGRRRRVDQAEVLDVQMIGNLCQKPVADIFHQCDNGRASICVCWIFLLTDCYRGNHRGSAQKILKQGDGIGRLGKVARRYQDSARRLPGEPAAQNINRRSELSRQIGESSFDRAARAEIFVFPAGTEDHDNVGVVERFEPAPNAPVDPGCIIAIANFRGGLRHRRDALEVTQRTLGIFIKRPKNRLLFAFGRDPVGALRRAQHAHRDADDRDTDDDADRDEQTDARMVPTRPVCFPGGLYLRRRQHPCHLLDISVHRKIASKSLPMTCNLHANHGRQERGAFGRDRLTAGKQVASAFERLKEFGF